MEHTANIHNHFTRTSSNSGLFIPQISFMNLGSYSLKHMAPYVWNNFSRVHPDICNYSNSCKSLKNFWFLNQIFSGTIQMHSIAFFSSSYLPPPPFCPISFFRIQKLNYNYMNANIRFLLYELSSFRGNFWYKICVILEQIATNKWYIISWKY